MYGISRRMRLYIIQEIKVPISQNVKLNVILRIGHHTGTYEKDAVYSGGNSEVLSRLMGARGR